MFICSYILHYICIYRITDATELGNWCEKSYERAAKEFRKALPLCSQGLRGTAGSGPLMAAVPYGGWVAVPNGLVAFP